VKDPDELAVTTAKRGRGFYPPIREMGQKPSFPERSSPVLLFVDAQESGALAGKLDRVARVYGPCRDGPQTSERRLDVILEKGSDFFQ
jgi:hypothetical protein